MSRAIEPAPRRGRGDAARQFDSCAVLDDLEAPMRLALLLHLHVQLAREVALRLDGHPSHSEGRAEAQHALAPGLAAGQAAATLAAARHLCGCPGGGPPRVSTTQTRRWSASRGRGIAGHTRRVKQAVVEGGFTNSLAAPSSFPRRCS